MDSAERERRSKVAEGLVAGLRAQGVVAVAMTFVDNSGITRVKAVPLERLSQAAAWGVGTSTVFDYFRFDDWVAAPSDGSGPVGDLRIIPDVRRVVALSAQPGWAWSPGDRYQQSGEPHPKCSRLLLQRQVDELAADGITVKAAYEIEWVVSHGPGEDFQPGVTGAGYGMARLIAGSDYCRDVVEALSEQGIEVEQIHPEYAAGQFEISVAAESPIDAADTAVLARTTIRAVGHQHAFRTSFSPKVDPAGVGNGGHVHLSLWRDGRNLMAGGDGRHGLTETGGAFSAGILSRLPALLTIGAPSVVSYLRLVPEHWAGAYACWGLENREAAMRMVTGSTGSTDWAANMEVKCFDLLANPYLLLSALLAAGSAGIAEGAALPEPVDVDPGALTLESLQERGIERLPTSLRAALDAFVEDKSLRQALGGPLVDSIAAVRESEIKLFATASEDEVAAATRWAH